MRSRDDRCGVDDDSAVVEFLASLQSDAAKRQLQQLQQQQPMSRPRDAAVIEQTVDDSLEQGVSIRIMPFLFP